MQYFLNSLDIIKRFSLSLLFYITKIQMLRGMMQKKKRWPLFLIIFAIALTLYNILPTVFYYTKPLKAPINESIAMDVAKMSAKRVNDLEKNSISWLNSFCKLLKINPLSTSVDKVNVSKINISFKNQKDAEKFKRHLPRAGALIPFVPSQLSLEKDQDHSKDVVVTRQIPITFDTKSINDYFSFSFKKNKKGNVEPLYKKVVYDRAIQLALALGSESDAASYVKMLLDNSDVYLANETALSIARELVDFTGVFGENSLISSRYFQSFTQGNFVSKSQTIDSVVSRFDEIRSNLRQAKVLVKEKKEKDFKQQLSLLEKKDNLLIKAKGIVTRHRSTFTKGDNPWTYSQLELVLNKNSSKSRQVLKLGTRNPFVDSLVIDWSNDKIILNLKKDVIAYKNKLKANLLQRYDQLVINELARVNRKTDEKILPISNEYVITLNTLTNSESFLTLDLKKIAKIQTILAKNSILENWNPTHPELKSENFPIYDYATYSKLPLEAKKLCLVVYSPILDSKNLTEGLKQNSIYVMAKGLDRIVKKYEKYSKTDTARKFLSDFENLKKLLQQNGFLGYSASNLLSNTDFANDFVFEKSDYYNSILAATREDFSVHGTKRFAILEFTNVEQRILATNRIETKIHEDLLKWKDEYNSAKVSIDSNKKFDIPSPTENIFLDNLTLSAKKYFRGDDRKILHWGLDLSGGKTVQIELKDQNNKLVTNEIDLKQGINELYSRVNKMGVSEVTIRTVGNNIQLEFPGSQGLSAAELVKASTMYFHVVNEKFAPQNPSLASIVNKFLTEVWNEAVVTNRKDVDSINAIAANHLYGATLNSNAAQPRSESAKILYDNGLRLSLPTDSMNSTFNDTVSKISLIRGEDYTKWMGQTHPLLVVFKNYGLEGSNLTNIKPGYDPSRGNFLSFEVASSYTNKDGIKISPRDELHSWTSAFSKEKVEGTVLEKYSYGKGWRMAVVLNESVISAPTLESALKDSAMITGSFTQREVNQLSSDLKAGSLTFTPKILSEKNVSPELGKEERVKGIMATILALVLVIIAMISYYRFSGLIASIAVVINLLIMWAALQNIQATLTLAGIAGVILTVGMAVDANVLVFERIREEFLATGRIITSIQTGYKKAFSAIFDSNLTTIIAALILLNFDAGPIKGFAITLIIGIVSSMFTALFMTRYFFTKWSENPDHKKLNMRNWIRPSRFNFIKNAKYVISFSMLLIIVGGFLLVKQRHTVFGMDFTGGFAINVEMQEKNIDYRTALEKAFVKNGATSNDFQIRGLNPANNLRIMFGTNMENKGSPFYGMPIQLENKNVKYAYENNPRIAWIVASLAKSNLTIKPHSLEKLDKSWTAMSGQMSDSMRNNAALGLFIALFCILIYLTFRFEFKFAVSAMICLIHDVLVTFGIIAILYYFGMPMQIDLHTIAAIMTIIGYSLNDTIIIFDRIREDMKDMRRASFVEIVNHALNVTLSRTTITSGTTLLVLIALVMFGGATIFSFALVMIIGVVFGTLSSLFIASPVMLLFNKREKKNEKRITLTDNN
jgi:SecD/SecF fusion protein